MISSTEPLELSVNGGQRFYERGEGGERAGKGGDGWEGGRGLGGGGEMRFHGLSVCPHCGVFSLRKGAELEECVHFWFWPFNAAVGWGARGGEIP